MLDDFIRHEATLPPYPGACCRMVDKWIREVTGFSALSFFGRDFESDEDVERWLAEPGGIAVAVNRVMRKCGFPKTKEPIPGDVGLVVHGAITDVVPLRMAICTKRGWISRSEGGLSLTPLRNAWKAWRIHEE